MKAGKTVTEGGSEFRSKIGTTLALIRNTIPGHSSWFGAAGVLTSVLPAAWTYETKYEKDGVNGVAGWYAGDLEYGKVEIVLANVSTIKVFIDTTMKKESSIKLSINDFKERQSPVTRFAAVMTTVKKDCTWMYGSDIWDRSKPTLLPYETDDDKKIAKDIASAVSLSRPASDYVYLVMVNAITSKPIAMKVAKRPKYMQTVIPSGRKKVGKTVVSG